MNAKLFFVLCVTVFLGFIILMTKFDAPKKTDPLAQQLDIIDNSGLQNRGVLMHEAIISYYNHQHDSSGIKK